MKTTFRRNSHNFGSGKRVIYIALALALGFLIYLARPLLMTVSAPFWQVRANISMGFSNFLNFFHSKDTLIAENNALKEKLNSYNTLLLSYTALESSYEEFLKEFNRENTGSEIAATVLVHPPQSPYDLIIIDAGRAEGVTNGDQISLPQGGALGMVEEVFENTARVMLYSTSGRETKAYLERDNVAILLKGAGGGTFKFSLPKDVVVEVGDRILTAGVKPELLAVVEKVDLKPTDAEKKVMAVLLTNVNNLRYVVVHP